MVTLTLIAWISVYINPLNLIYFLPQYGYTNFLFGLVFPGIKLPHLFVNLAGVHVASWYFTNSLGSLWPLQLIFALILQFVFFKWVDNTGNLILQMVMILTQVTILALGVGISTETPKMI